MLVLLESLIETVRICDEKFSPSTERVWRDAMQQAIDFLIAHR
jgi:hypothetical protein